MKEALSDAEIYRALTEIFRDTFDDEQIVLRPDFTAKDVKGWDSYQMVNIIIAVEERFGIKLRTREIDTLRCIGDFVDLIRAKTAA